MNTLYMQYTLSYRPVFLALKTSKVIKSIHLTCPCLTIYTHVPTNR